MEVKKRLFYRIGEVCRVTGIPAHVLRYWETEFPQLKPTKNSAGQRVYRYKDILSIMRIKQLLYEEGYTIAGAKKALRQAPASALEEEGSAGRKEEPADRSPGLEEIRQKLKDILEILDGWSR